VIAVPAGALPEIVEHGRTGFLVKDAMEMAEAIHCARFLDSEECRRAARERFCLRRTIGSYMELYHRLAGKRASRDPELEVAHVT
jgi:glycosyltransferase involved in cell wall biosynthesis